MKNLYILGGIAVIGVLIIGGSKAASHGETLVREVRKEVNRLSPGPHEAERIRNLLEDRHRQIREEYNKIARVERQAEGVKKEVSALNAEIEKQKSFLLRAEEIIVSGSQEERINGETYTREQIETDAVNRLNAIDNLNIQRSAKEKITTDLIKAAKTQRKNLTMAETDLSKKKSELDTLDIRLEAARLRTLARGLTDDLLREGFGEYDELAQSWSSYLERVEDAEVSAGVTQSGLGHFAVEWDSTQDSGNLLEDISKALGRKPQAEPESQSSVVAYETN